MAFYPTLGAFCFLFMRQGRPIQQTVRIIAGAVVSATIGSILYVLQPGELTFFLTTAATLFLIQLCKWDAAPIMAVALIPFFAHPAAVWMLPLAVLLSLGGLLIPIWALGRLERVRWLEAFEHSFQRRFRGKQDVMAGRINAE